jgi:hypothetical protein
MRAIAENLASYSLSAMGRAVAHAARNLHKTALSVDMVGAPP